jgi:monofunctional biosynthetic peptidoglycan transglycosylase
VKTSTGCSPRSGRCCIARKFLGRTAARAARATGRGVIVVLAAAFSCLVYEYLTMPDVRLLRTRNPAVTAFMELRAHQAAARGEPIVRDQRWVPYAKISPHLKRAVIVTEDSAFWRHEGVDYAQLRDAVEENLERMEFARGASTITQQLAKNLYLSPSKNPFRKVKELLIARALEVELTKQRILELYLNVIEWGDGIWGAEAAARRYFHTSAADLSASQAALLAAAIANPHIMDPGRPSARLLRRQQMIMRRMGAVTPPPVVVEPVVVPSPGPEVPALPPPDAPLVIPGTPLPPPSAGRGGRGNTGPQQLMQLFSVHLDTSGRRSV